MIERALVHVAGPPGAGKTAFIERLLEADFVLAICIRAEHDPELRREHESRPGTHAELRRFREAGAGAVALYRFGEPDTEAFFMSAVMQDYSEAVLIEGDCPVDPVDISVFVAPVPAAGRSLLRRVVREHAVERQASVEQLARALEDPGALARLLGDAIGEPLVALASQRPDFLDDLRRSLKAKLSDARRAPPPAPTEHWALDAGYEGIQRAQMVVVNVRSEAERARAAALVADVARLRKDEAVFRDVLGWRGSKVAVSALSVDLVNPKDAGLRKAIARVKRSARRRRA